LKNAIQAGSTQTVKAGKDILEIKNIIACKENPHDE
jgi:hypothetical protein